LEYPTILTNSGLCQYLDTFWPKVAHRADERRNCHKCVNEDDKVKHQTNVQNHLNLNNLFID